MTPEELLNQLSEHQAQRDLIDLKRRELLDAVKIPQEVEEAHADGTKKKAEVEKTYQYRLDLLEEEKRQRLESVVVPQEIVAALREIEARRKSIADEYEETRCSILREKETKKSEIDGQFSNSVAEIYRQVEARKRDINSEFQDKIDAVESNIADLTKKVKDAVIKEKQSVKGNYLHAVYSKGRVTWATDTLDSIYFSLNKMIETISNLDILEIGERLSEVVKSLGGARKEGDPSVSIRKV